jgi:uncharacterized protein (DUF885 family)
MSTSESHARLNALAEAWYRRNWERFPTSGSTVGLSEFDGRLEAPDASLYEAALADARDTLRDFEALPAPAAGASRDERLDRKELEAQLRLAVLQLGTIRSWKRNPAEPVDVVVTSLFYLLMRRDFTRREVAEALLSRLEKVPAYLRATRSRVSDPVALWVLVAIEAAEGGVPFLADLVAGIRGQHPALAGRAEAGAAAATLALEEYAAWLRELKERPLATDPAIGREALGHIIRWNHGLTESVADIQAWGRTQIAAYRERLVALAKELDPTATPADIIARENRRFAESNPDLLADYRRLTLEVRDRLVAEKILDMPPGEVCDVVATPEFLRPVLPTAAYSAPGPMDAVQKGIFYATEPPASLPPDEYRDNIGQHFPVAATCAHEAYPGHHVQLCWANQAPGLIRKLADHIIFMEGWTLYCEQLMVELGYYPNAVYELAYLNDQLWRACRVVIDASVQSGEMSVDEAVAMLRKEVGFTELRARAELNWYTQSPGTPMSYLLGKGKTLALRAQYRERHPDAAPREFHRWLLTQGSIPQSWLLETMD